MKVANKLVLYAMCAALVVVSNELLAFLPNVELVTFLLMMYSLYFDLKGSIMIAVLFCFIQTLLYGVGIWTLMYFIVWPLLVFVTSCLKKQLNNYHRCALFSGMFGLCFGFLFSIPYFLISLKMGWIYFLKGIPFDLIHGIANYIIMIFLYEKMSKIFFQLKERYKI